MEEDLHIHLKSQEKEVNLEIDPSAVEARRRIVQRLLCISYEYGIHPAPLFLAVQLLDRYGKYTSKVASACMFVASKYEDIDPFAAEDLSCESGCSPDDIIHIETKVLKAVQFRISQPTVWHFLHLYCNAAPGSILFVHRAYYFAEHSLLFVPEHPWKPSVVAAASVYLARINETLDAWTAELQEATGLLLSEVLPIATFLSHQIGTDKIIHKKYSSAEVYHVSRLGHVVLPIIPEGAGHDVERGDLAVH